MDITHVGKNYTVKVACTADGESAHIRITRKGWAAAMHVEGSLTDIRCDIIDLLTTVRLADNDLDYEQCRIMKIGPFAPSEGGANGN